MFKRRRNEDVHSIFSEPSFAANRENRDRLIDSDFGCRGCGYNLRGLKVDMRCPECGRPVSAIDAAASEDEATRHSVHDELVIFPDREGQTIGRDWSCANCGRNLRGQWVGGACPVCGEPILTRPGRLDVPGYARWLTGRRAATPRWVGWLVTLGILLAGGAWAVVGTLISGGAGPLALVVVGPVTEEIMKVALIVVTVETRPYLFSNRAQIFIAGAASGLGFAAIENALYLGMGNPSAMLVTWRWTVCVALHVGCTTIACLGAARMWRQTMRELRPPTVSAALPAVVTAAIVHGAYNAFALGMDVVGLRF